MKLSTRCLRAAEATGCAMPCARSAMASSKVHRSQTPSEATHRTALPFGPSSEARSRTTVSGRHVTP
eukprot:scaffold9015_cov96-Isochrysis_galbana.AAC.12